MSILFTSATIGTLEIPNRIVRSATAEKMADNSTGIPREQLKDLWVDLAKGGTGLIITGHMYVHPTGKCHPEMTPIYADEHIAPLKEIVDAVHAHGAKIAVQINHGGMQCAKEVVDGTIAPSAIAEEFLQQPAREMSVDEIQMLIAAYAQAARRVKAAGFDAVQIHGAHGYLINQFNSPYVNKRTDEWGGDLPGRTKFLREVASAVREQVGPDYPVFIKLGMEDGVEDGLTKEEGAQIVAMLSDMGIEAVEISGGVRSNSTAKGIKNEGKETYFRYLAELARPVTDLPIILVGGMRTKGVMEKVLADGLADFVAMCRPLINDPNFPNQMQMGEQTKSGCISSNNCWAEDLGVGIGCKCPV
jgi:2,4-dienoyl-CoA reductase-like NADH-dependent reductase (Old Yellow Enzyme family)